MARGRQSRRRARWGALGLIEEGFYLLRQLPVSTHAAYLVGTGPFLLAFVFFTTDMARSVLAGSKLGGWSLLLALLYLWMKVWQSWYASSLFAGLSPDGAESVRWSWRGAAALLGVQAFSIPAHIIGAVLTLPIGWVVAFFQAASAVAFVRGSGRGDIHAWRRLMTQSARLSNYRSLQNHGTLLVMFIFWIVVWLGVTSLFGIVPMVIKLFTGIETIFTQNPVAALGNSTTLAVTLSLSFLVVGPLLKAVSAVRCFYALAETTGDDLRARLRAAVRGSASAGASGSGPVLVMVLFFIAGLAVPRAIGAEGESDAGPAVVVESADQGGVGDPLEAELRGVLRQREFQWRLPRTEESVEGSGAFGDLLRDFGDSLGHALKYAGESWSRWMRDLLGDRSSASTRRGNRGLFGALAEMTALQWILYAGAAVAAALLVLYGIRAWRSGRVVQPGAGGLAGGVPEVDLESELVQADALEQDAWLELAQEKVATGEYRLAVRAVFLACLASMAGRKLLRLRRSKSNRDYLRELSLKARDELGLTDAFSAGTATFERTWYGDHPATEAEVDAMRTNYRRITREP